MTGVPFTDGRERARDEELRAARFEGWHAGLRGVDPRENPHEPMTETWQAWNKFHGFAARLHPDD